MENPFNVIIERLVIIEGLLSKINPPTIIHVPKPEPPNDIIKIDEAEKITGYKVGYIYELVRKNSIPYHRKGRALRFSRQELDAWIKSGRPHMQDLIEHTLK